MDMFYQAAEARPGNAMLNPSKNPTQPQTTLDRRMTLGGKGTGSEHCWNVTRPPVPELLPHEPRYILELFQELHCLMLLGVLPHVALQAIHICGGEVTHATSEETTTSDWSDDSLLALLQTPQLPECKGAYKGHSCRRTKQIYTSPSYDVKLLLGSENLCSPKKPPQASQGLQMMFLPEISLVPLS